MNTLNGTPTKYDQYVNLLMSQVAEPKTFEQVVQLQLSANASRQLDAVATFLSEVKSHGSDG